MDGLLFDTEALYQEAAILAAADGGHDVSSGVFSQTIGLPWPQSRALLLAHFGATFPVEDFVATWVRHFEVIAATRLALKPGVIELLVPWTTSGSRELSPHLRRVRQSSTIWSFMIWSGGSTISSGTETTRAVSLHPIPSSKLPSFWVWNPGHVLPWKIHTTESDRQPPPA